MNLNDALKKYNRLSDAALHEMGNELISVYAGGIKPVKKGTKPQAIILGGQPGAGKTELIEAAQRELNGNVVVYNADDFRIYHPHHKEIINEPVELYPDITAPYSIFWNNMLSSFCETNKLNYILETTFSSDSRMNDTIRHMKSLGYEVTIMILAVHGDISYLNTLSRYEDMLAKSSFGRPVGKAPHDTRYKAIEQTLQQVQDAHLYDHINIYGRAGLNNNKNRRYGLVEKCIDCKNPLKEYLQEREKQWSDNDKRYFMQEALLLVEKMVRRKAPYSDIKALFDNYTFASY